MVAARLCVLVALVASRIGWLKTARPRQRQHVRADWHLSDRGHVRTVGDYPYFGFFKGIRDSTFARLDTLAYSPHCAALAILIGIAACR
jgi:hypothetical protein